MAYKIKTIEVSEILHQEAVEQKRAEDTVSATDELKDILKKVCSNKAFTLGGLADYLKNKNKTDNLILNQRKGVIKNVLDDIIIKNHGGGYSHRELYEGWKEVKQYTFLFIWRRFYYFDPEVLEKEERQRIESKNW